MSQSDERDEVESTEAGFITHLLELRDRLLRVVIFLVILFGILFAFANDIYNFLATPLLAHMPQGSSMIAIEVISPFLTPLKMAMYAALMLGMPYILYQMWSFVAPGLYKHEKRLATPLLISSIILFYAGVAFAYFVVFPLVFAFLVSVAPEGVAVMTDINKYLDFVLALFFAFGLAFEVPVATIILIAMGVTTADSLLEKRPYIIVGAFVIGMLLTPPDVISQIMLALPMWLLFEVGIVMSRILIQPKDDDEYAEDDNEEYANASLQTATPSTAAVGATAAAASSSSQSSASQEDETPAEETTPTGYSAAAYPDDYEPLSEEELEAELDKASEWDDDDDEDDEDDFSDEDTRDADDNDDSKSSEDSETSETDEADDDDKSQGENDESEPDEEQETTEEKPTSRDTQEFLDDLKKRYPDEDGSVA